MDPGTMAAATVAALSPYLVEAVKGAAGKVGEAAYESGAKLLRFLKGKLSGGDEQKALSRLEQEPEDADNQAALRVVLKESLKGNATFRDDLEALLKALPKNAVSQSATVVGDSNVVNQVEDATNTTIKVGRLD
jgi:hypothetical protein